MLLQYTLSDPNSSRCTRFIHVMPLGYTPSMKPKWPPCFVDIRNVFGFALNSSTGKPSSNNNKIIIKINTDCNKYQNIVGMNLMHANKIVACTYSTQLS